MVKAHASSIILMSLDLEIPTRQPKLEIRRLQVRRRKMRVTEAKRFKIGKAARSSDVGEP